MRYVRKELMNCSVSLLMFFVSILVRGGGGDGRAEE